MPLDIVNRLKRRFGEDAFDWASRTYILDWVTVAFIWALGWYAKYITVTERDFSIKDPLIHHPHRKNQVSSPFNQFIAVVAPSIMIVAVALIKRSLMDVHHGLVGILATRGIATVVTRFLKNRIGRLRPDFLSRCKWDKMAQICTGDPKDIMEGRRSFPSGHSATAFSGMFYLSLFLAGQTAAWCFHANRFPPGFLRSRMQRFVIACLPLFWAFHVALSRMEDNRHHKEDVIVGGCIGVLSALIGYLMFWPSPFSSSNFDADATGQPRYIYESRAPGRGRVEFELAPMDDNTNAV
ncbi:lipid phosphate phosphatase 1 [Coprinopsis marcescibilis]|uniref:Lipid phosphate phosphatase 1 n=1 Tax=Coprinopsis marcescibilis TaxID=230819 RepID=A0A5C3LA95_COPMA|nr:lipid phosphate phosphatase 1 [Coprinopsis marcescibilis]